MTIALLTGEGFAFLLRWLHIFFGVIWIGHLYYFNFVQGSFFAETDGATKSNAIQKLVPRALWWFRWGAMWTIVTGVAIIEYRLRTMGIEAMNTPWGIFIGTGMLLGLVMWANVWFVIWPNQKVVIANAVAVASGGQAIPGAADRGARAGVASRHNVLFSIPLLFFMAAARNLVTFEMSPEPQIALYWIVFFVILLGLEFNALKGKTGPLTTVKGVITSGFILTAILYALQEVLL